MAKRPPPPPQTVTLGVAGARQVLETLKRYGAQRFDHAAAKEHAVRAIALIQIPVAPVPVLEPEPEPEPVPPEPAIASEVPRDGRRALTDPEP